MIIDKTIVQTTAPESSNVLWLDSSEDKLKYSISGEWRELSASGEDVEVATLAEIDALFDEGGGGGSGSGSSSGSTPSPQQDGVHFVGFDASESQVGDSGTVNFVGVTFAEILANPEGFDYYDDHGNGLIVQTTEDVGADYVDLLFESAGGTGQFHGGMHITESSWTWVYAS